MSRNNPTPKWKALQKNIKANHESLLAYEADRNARQNEERKLVETTVPPHKRRKKRK